MSQQYKNPEEVRATTGIDAPLDKKIHVEHLKLNSNGLRGNVLEEMTDPNLPAVSEDSYNLMKHFGMYQQDNRDVRNERKRAGLDKDFSFMIRAKIAGGVATPEQYLTLDDIATKHTSGSIRLTTRQTVQFHGVGKFKLQDVCRDMNERLLTSYGACGDVVRNVMACPVVDIDREHPGREVFIELAREISFRTLPRTNAFYDIFINGEKDNSDAPKFQLRDESEDLYGKTYMPRKFKIGVTIPEDNCVDIFTQDLGLVAILEKGKVRGYNIMVGGGLGHSHSNKETYPRAGEAVAFVGPDDIISAVDAVITIQRDYGDRTNRKHARLKYLLDDVGPEWFHEEIVRRVKGKVSPAVPVASWGVNDHLGWHEQVQSGLHYVGIFIENGRIIDGATPMKTNLRRIVEKFRPQVRLTAQQNIILANIPTQHVKEISAILADTGLSTGNGHLSTLRRQEIACVALPTCGLALAEAERALPSLIGKLEELGYGNERISIRMSGCPNSCSRAPMAELGLIGCGPGKYNIYTGGDYEGTRTNKLFKERVVFEEVPAIIGSLIDRWRAERQSGEAFGDFCHRLGVDTLKG
ncbi:NADPH-dependent assimilatory sulfite reductase hemoprotein subunit [bacterium]|nr:NADPH-dependent assimilatory sulfite reductase hemoprotein subunit [bacterium]